MSANSAEYGGCAFVSGDDSTVSVSSGSRITGNNATGVSSGNGGAFYLLNASSFALSGGASLESNVATMDGGGVYAASVRNVTFAKAMARSNRRASDERRPASTPRAVRQCVNPRASSPEVRKRAIPEMPPQGWRCWPRRPALCGRVLLWCHFRQQRVCIEHRRRRRNCLP